MAIKKKLIYRALFIFLGIIIIFFLCLPTIIKTYAIKNSKELVGRQIAIGKLKYNYFTSTVKVYDFKMFEQSSSDVFTSFDTLILNLEPYKLINNTKSIEQLYIKGLMINVVLQDSTFNFDDLIAFYNTPKDTLETEKFKYNLTNLELKGANFLFDNKNVKHVTNIEDFSFFIPYIGWDQEEKSNADIKFNFRNGGYLQSVLNINPVDGSFDSEITVKNLNLEPFYEYVLEYADINSFKGLMNAQIKIIGNTNDPVKSIISGHADVHDFAMTDRTDKEVMKAIRIDCNLKNIDYANSSYVIDSLKLTQPYIYVEMDSLTNNLFKLFKLDPNGNPLISESNSDVTIDTTSNSNLYYAINNLNINSGIMDYSDNLTGTRFNYHLSEIKVNSDSLFSNSKWINIYSDMLLNNRGTLNAKLGFNPTDYTNLNLDMTIENFLLSDINIYSKYYTGHNILVGDFYYYSNSKITNGAIVSENKLLVKNVSVENAQGGLFTLPLKFAIFLLKDKNGDVNLELPVRGDLNDPKVSVGKIIWNTFKNLITRAVASPIKLLAGLIDGDPKEYEEITFTYLDTIPSEAQFRKLDKLLELETKKEGLKIELQYAVDDRLQKEAIALNEVGKQYFKETEKDYLKTEKEFQNYLRTRVMNDSISVKDAAFQITNSSTIDSLAHMNNETLIKNVQDYLKTKKDSTHITVIRLDLKGPENAGSQSRFKIKYDMLEE